MAGKNVSDGDDGVSVFALQNAIHGWAGLKKLSVALFPNVNHFIRVLGGTAGSLAIRSAARHFFCDLQG